MSEPVENIETSAVDCSDEIARLEADNAALQTKIATLKKELNDKLFKESQADIAALNQELASYTEREIAIMSDFSLALRHLNDSVSDLQAVLAVEKGEEKEEESQTEVEQ